MFWVWASRRPAGKYTDVNRRQTHWCWSSALNYQRAIGSINWASVCTGPLAHTVSVLSQYMILSNPGPRHIIAMKRVFRYIKWTIDLGLMYHRAQISGPLYDYSDTDWAGDIDTRRSTSGYLFIYGGGAISWGSKWQRTVALSSTENVYMALSTCASEAIWLRKLLKDLTFSKRTTTIYYENQSAISLVDTTKFHNRTKHIYIRYHFIKVNAIDSWDVS